MAYHKIDWEIILYNHKRVKDCAKEWGISPRQVQIYSEEGRIEGAFKYGLYWLIPKDAQNRLKRIYSNYGKFKLKFIQ